MASPAVPVKPRYGAALTIIQNLYGWIVQEVESYPLLQTGGPFSQIVPQNGDRVGLLIMDQGANNVNISLVQNAPAFPLLLLANGGSVSFDLKDDFTLTTRAWYGQAQTAIQNVYVLEIIAVRPLPPGSQ